MYMYKIYTCIMYTVYIIQYALYTCTFVHARVQCINSLTCWLAATINNALHDSANCSCVFNTSTETTPTRS